MTGPLVPGEAPGPREPRPKRRLRTKLLALAVSTCVGLLAVELATRLATKDPLLDGSTDWGLDRPDADWSLGPKAFYESLRYPRENDRWGPPFAIDPEIGFGLAPSCSMTLAFPEAPGGAYHVRTNALGLRDDRPLVPKGAALRILALGDSMTFGLGVEREEAYPAVLERELATKGRAVEVVNAGVSCWGQCEEVAFLERRARALEPDVVLLELTIANDVLDDLRYREESGRLVPDPGLAADLAGHWIFHNPLATGSRAYRHLVWAWGRHAVRYEAMLAPERLARASDLVRRARDLARGMNARFVLTIAPPDFQVANGWQERLLGSRRIDDALLRRAKEDGILALDLADALRAARREGTACSFARDMHWNARGHEVVGRALAAWAPLRDLKESR